MALHLGKPAFVPLWTDFATFAPVLAEQGTEP